MKTQIMEALGAFKSVSNYDGKPNQFEIKFENGEVFQSYDSVIVVSFYLFDSEFSNKIYFGSDWDYSKTTSKYRNKFLNRDSKWCKEKVTSNEIKVINF